ncbi:MAG: RNA polymerase subunit sigma [Firmicutes bacterium]|nr:RNA polymerase subunit sigma [Bacillota bacterium]
MRDIDQMVVNLGDNSQKLDEFIDQHEFFIIKCASKTAKHYIQKDDDEWSVALAAFSEAIKKYDYGRGSFISFAELMIHRRLVDYFRIQGRYSAEVAVDSIENHAVIEVTENNLKFEIEAISQVLKSYGFTFMDLTTCSPKAQKTKNACGKTIAYLLEKPMLINEMGKAKRLPINIIEKNVGVPRKILDRHRKYIIAAT